EARENGFARGCFSVRGNAVGDCLRPRSIIAYYSSRKLPLLAEDVRQGKRVGCGGDAVETVKGAHERTGASFHRCVKGRQIDLSQGVFGDLHRVVVSSRFGGPISN